MANLSLRIPGATFANSIGENVPAIVADDAELFHLFGGTEAKSVRNLAGLKVASTVVGTPTYPTDAAARLSNQNGYEAGSAAAGQPFSYAGVITRPPLGVSVGIMGNWNQAGTTNALLFINGTELRFGITGSPRVIHTVPSSGIMFVAGTYDGATAKAFHGVSATLDSTSAAYSGGAAAEKFRIGGSGLTATDTFDGHCGAYWKRALSDVEVQEVYEYFQREMARRGISGV